MNDKRLWEICKEIYRKMYKEAKPSADFDDLVKTGEAKQKQFFMRYYLPIERQSEITEEIMKKHKLRSWERSNVKSETCLGCSPNTSEETWKKMRRFG